MKHPANGIASSVNEKSTRKPIMKILAKRSSAFACALLATLGLATAHAQTTANWIGPASGGEWNTGANWDTGFPPLDATTNAFIDTGTNVSYNVPMATAGFGLLTLNGSLAVNASGFNNTGILMTFPTGTKSLWITNAGAAVNITGDLTMGSNTVANLAPGASLTVSGRLIIAANEGSKANNTSAFTNSGGTLNASSTAVNNNGGTGTGLLSITGGTNNLGNTSVGRYHGSSASTLGTEGLSISGGFVTTSNLTLSGNSHLTAFISGGTVTNYGTMSINGITAGRYSRMFQTGGYVVVPEPGIVNLNSTTAGSLTAIYSVTGGTNIVGGFYFGNSNSPTAATQSFTNSSVVYIGSLGITADGTSINTLALNNGGMFGADADWTGNAGMLLNAGAYTFQAAAQDGTPHNITLNGALNGTGSLVKNGAGTLTLSGDNVYSGVTYIQNGTLALAINQNTSLPGSIASGNITVGSGATFDVTQDTGYAVNPLQTLGGFGNVNGSVTVAPTGIINPGSNTVTGLLTFNNDLIETNGAVNHFDIGDTINVTGNLNVSGSNVVEITGSVTVGTPYALFHYGTVSGDAGSFGVSGATGSVSNSVADKTLYLVVTASLRANTNVTWVGNSTANDWDTHNLTNWVNAGTGALDFFLSGDTAIFTDLAGNNTNVNIPGSVSPAAVIVNATSNFVFSGAGSITGPSTTLTKTNSGNLTISNTNTYAGATIFAGGVVDIADIENGGTPSPLGSSPADSSSLVFNGGTLEYLGASQSVDHGATFQTNGGTLSITNGTTLTMSGTLTGPGALTKIGNGQLTLTVPNNYLGGTLINAGTIRAAQGSGATLSALGTNTITLNGTTSAATFQFGGDAETLNNPLHIVNTNNFILNGGNDQVTDITGDGLVNLEGASGNVFTIAGDMSTFTGIINVDTISNARFLPNNGSVVGGPNVTFNLGAGSGFINNRNGNLTTLLGSIFGGASTTVQGASSTDNRPTTYIVGLNNVDNEFDGRFTEVSAARKVNLVKAGTGTFTLVQSQPYTGFTTISNGVLALAFGTNTTFADGSLDGTTNIEITATGVLDVSGRSDATLQLGGNQTLAGAGTLRGSVNVFGVLAPDGGAPNTLGTLTVTNTANLDNLTWMKLNRGTTPNSDKLVAPIINLSGNLVITNIGAPLHVGDTFTLFQGTLAGGFGSVILPNYYTFDTTQLPVNGAITVTSYTPPVMTTDFSTFSSGSITFNITGGIVGNGVSVLTSTNLALPLTNWTAVATGNFDGSGNFSAPVTVDPTASPQQYYIMATQ